MPSIDYRAVKERCTVFAYLDAIGWRRQTVVGEMWKGGCPVHRSTTPTSKAFHAWRRGFTCHKRGCRARGSVLDLVMGVERLPLYSAAVHLCKLLGVPVPYLRRQAARPGDGTGKGHQ